MEDLKELYQDILLDHNRNPRSYHKLEDANQVAEGYNPLCGDKFSVYLKMDGDRIADLSFQGSGCAISKASASMMTALLKGKSKKEAQELCERFRKLVTTDAALKEDDLGDLAVFSNIRSFPNRVKCAVLAWHTLRAALEGEKQTVTTEE